MSLGRLNALAAKPPSPDGQGEPGDPGLAVRSRTPDDECMLVFGIVSTKYANAIAVYLRREDAERDLVDVLSGEPAEIGSLAIVPIDLADGSTFASPN